MAACIAYEMRRQREARGLSQDQLAKELYSTRATIQAYEARRNRPDEDFCARLDAFFGTGLLFQALWFHAQNQHLKEWLESFVVHESEAVQIEAFEPMSIPGLLQVEGYMRAGIAMTKANEERISARLARQEVLSSGDPPYLWVVVDEVAIRRPVGGAAVMKPQLRHLLMMAEMENVTIQVVRETVGRYPGVDGGLALFVKPDGRTVGYIEAQFGGRLIEDPEQVRRLGMRYDQIRAKALPDHESMALIASVLESMDDDSLAEEQT